MDILTKANALSLSEILRAAYSNRPVVRLIDNNRVDGVARSICDQTGLFYPRDTDVRDAYLWVTTDITEQFWPIRELMAQNAKGEFLVL